MNAKQVINIGGVRQGGKREELGQKPVPVPFCPPKNPKD
jgi:hypothetical protein